MSSTRTSTVAVAAGRKGGRESTLCMVIKAPSQFIQPNFTKKGSTKPVSNLTKICFSTRSTIRYACFTSIYTGNRQKDVDESGI